MKPVGGKAQYVPVVLGYFFYNSKKKSDLSSPATHQDKTILRQENAVLTLYEAKTFFTSTVDFLVTHAVSLKCISYNSLEIAHSALNVLLSWKGSDGI